MSDLKSKTFLCFAGNQYDWCVIKEAKEVQLFLSLSFLSNSLCLARIKAVLPFHSNLETFLTLWVYHEVCVSVNTLRIHDLYDGLFIFFWGFFFDALYLSELLLSEMKGRWRLWARRNSHFNDYYLCVFVWACVCVFIWSTEYSLCIEHHLLFLLSFSFLLHEYQCNHAGLGKLLSSSADAQTWNEKRKKNTAHWQEPKQQAPVSVRAIVPAQVFSSLFFFAVMFQSQEPSHVPLMEHFTEPFQHAPSWNWRSVSIIRLFFYRYCRIQCCIHTYTLELPDCSYQFV